MRKQVIPCKTTVFRFSQTKTPQTKKQKSEKQDMHSEPLTFLQHLWGWQEILDSNSEKDKLYPVWKGLNIMIQSSVNEAWMRFFLLFSPISSALLSSFGSFILAGKITKEQRPPNHSQWQQRHSVPLGAGLQQYDHSQSLSPLYLNTMLGELTEEYRVARKTTKSTKMVSII